MIGIIGAMEIEVSKLKEAMELRTTEECAGMRFYCGTLCGKDVVIVRSGIGKVNAALCVQILCDRFGVDMVWNTGIAGSLDAKIDIGDIVISKDALQHDVDAVAFGYPKGVIPQMDVSTFVADAKLAELAKTVCEEELSELTAHVGRVVSGDQFVADKARKEQIVSDFGGLCTEMEGAAVAQAAHLNGIPFLILRAISDKADDSASMDYPEFERLAVEHMVHLTMSLVNRV